MGKTIGILGGMGPEATVYMFELIIKHTRADKDQEHIPVVIYSNPEVPERTCSIVGDGPSPVPFLMEGVKRLLAGGADFIIMPCVTAHYFIPEVKAQIDFRFLSLLEESLKWAQEMIPRVKKVGLVASSGTVRSGLFHKPFGDAGIEVIEPEEEEQSRVMEAIFGREGIKAGFTSGAPKDMIVNVSRELIARGAEAIIAGCTEVPLVLKDRDISVPLIEPMMIMAERSILEAGYEYIG